MLVKIFLLEYVFLNADKFIHKQWFIFIFFLLQALFPANKWQQLPKDTFEAGLPVSSEYGCNHVKLRGLQEKDDAFYSFDSSTKTMFDLAVSSSAAVCDSEPANAVGHARGNCTAEQHCGVAGQARAFACQVHRQSGRDKFTLASVTSADREQSHSARSPTTHQQWHF